MMFLLDAGALGLAIVPLVLLGLLLFRGGQPRYALLFVILLALDAAVTALPLTFELNPEAARWNWVGKLFSLSWALLFVAAGPLGSSEAGLTLRQREGSVIPAAIVTLVAIVATGFLVSGQQQLGAETLLFQATMPGLAEEVVYRGVLFALLLRAFGATEKRGGAAVHYCTLVTALAFGLWHGLNVVDGSLDFNFMFFLFPFLGGLIFGWLRASTGSLLFPIVAHNGANLSGYLFNG
jgi:uncharacterized protein